MSIPQDDRLEYSLLSERELQVLELVAAGLTNQDIAAKLDISKRTVDNHISNILMKTKSENRVALVRWALAWGKVCLNDVNCCALPTPLPSPMSERVYYNPRLPLAVYRELAAHLQLLDGISVRLLPQTCSRFDYELSQIEGIAVTWPPTPNMQARCEEILQHYGLQHGGWQGSQ